MINGHLSGDSSIQRNKIIELTLTIFTLYFSYPLYNLETTQAVEPYFEFIFNEISHHCSGNGLVRAQGPVITWTIDDKLSFWPLGAYFKEVSK